MSDEPNDTTPVPESDDETPPTKDEAGAGDEESLLERRGVGRPTIVYVALALGGLVLVLLLVIVWLSSRDDDRRDSILCLDISIAEASDLILNGDVSEIHVLIDDQQPLHGLSAVQLHLIDGQCRTLPEGADNRDVLYQMLGQVALYNEASDAEEIEVNYIRGNVPAALLNTSTPIPVATEPPSPTETPASPAAIAPTPTATATATSVASPPEI